MRRRGTPLPFPAVIRGAVVVFVPIPLLFVSFATSLAKQFPCSS